MEHTPVFTVCALFYGDYPDIARRLLDSLNNPAWEGLFNFRIGLNNVGDKTAALIKNVNTELIITGDPPYYKYPMMRRLFYEKPITTKYVMWFDDDSCFSSNVNPDIFIKIEQALQQYHMVGLKARCRLQGKQAENIRKEPWYNYKPMSTGFWVSFCSGAWWAARFDFLSKHNWPIPSLEHRGGDVLLGALCYQHDYTIGSFKDGIFIGANASGKWDSYPRRGCNQQPWGVK